MDDILKVEISPPKINRAPVHLVYSEDDVISDLWAKKLQGRSLREIASDYPGITHADIHRMLRGNFPKSPEKRIVLGLPFQADVIYLYGVMPDGEAVSLGAQLCECGQWFISNHPARKSCFICSPYRGERKS